MTIPELIKWQWVDYDKYHMDKGNLLIHIFAVPLTWMVLVLFILGAINASLIVMMFALSGFFLSLMVQNVGHRREQNPPVPFESKMNFLQRLLVEQFINFPRFVFTGGWFRNFFRK